MKNPNEGENDFRGKNKKPREQRGFSGLWILKEETQPIINQERKSSKMEEHV